MKLRRATPLVLVALIACQPAPSPGGTDGAAGTAGNPVADGGTDGPPSFAMPPEATSAVPLTAEMLNGILPPAWHVGETWEIMFCTANQDWTWTGDYDTTRVLFRVIAVPEPGAYTAVLEVRQHVFPYSAWVGEVTTINGVQVGRGQNRVILEKTYPREMIFDGRTFDVVGPLLKDRYGHAYIDYRSIGDHLGTFAVADFIPHVPIGLRNPEIAEETERSARFRSTLTPTFDGLVYQVETGTDSILRSTVFWRRGESWWSYARVDTADMWDGADAGRDEYHARNGNTTFAWAVKLPLGQPGSINCNSKR